MIALVIDYIIIETVQSAMVAPAFSNSVLWPSQSASASDKFDFSPIIFESVKLSIPFE